MKSITRKSVVWLCLFAGRETARFTNQFTEELDSNPFTWVRQKLQRRSKTPNIPRQRREPDPCIGKGRGKWKGNGEGEGEGLPSQFGDNANRHSLHIVTDKPTYQPGETVYATCWLLHAKDREPSGMHATATQHEGSFSLQILGPRKDVVYTADLTRYPGNATVFANWQVPENAPGGEYSVTVQPPVSANTYSRDPLTMCYKLEVQWLAFSGAKAQRKFQVSARRLKRMKLQLDFQREGYGPNETAHATLSAMRPSRDPLDANASVDVVARIDGVTVYSKEGVGPFSAGGTLQLAVPLPEAGWHDGLGTLSATVIDAGVVETVSMPIPLASKAIQIEILPEGGELVEGLASRIYVAAKYPNGEPADISAAIVPKISAGHAASVAMVNTSHEGRGVSSDFTPAEDIAYELNVLYPEILAGMRKPLPATLRDGATLRAHAAAYNASEPLSFFIGAALRGSYVLRIFRREWELVSARAQINTDHGTVNVSVTLPLKGCCVGVLRATLYSPNGKPLAERLVWRHPAETLGFEVTAEPAQVAPGGRVTITVKSSRPDVAIGVAVVDGRARAVLPRRQRPPALPELAYFEDEVAELTDADAYIGINGVDDGTLMNSIATREMRIDLLLGVQGWRRFVYEDVPAFLRTGGHDKTDMDTRSRLLAVGPAPTSRSPVFRSRRYSRPSRGSRGRRGSRGLRGSRGSRGKGRGSARPSVGKGKGPARPGGAAAAAEVRPVGRAKGQGKPQNQQQNGGGAKGAGKRMAFRRRPMRDMRPMRPALADALSRVTTFRREYYHVSTRRVDANEYRQDFEQTVMWTGSSTTDSEGLASFSFDASDLLTSFTVAVDGAAHGGVLGAGRFDAFKTQQSLLVEAKLPAEATHGDHILAPVLIRLASGSSGSNETKPVADVTVELSSKGALAIGRGEGVESGASKYTENSTLVTSTQCGFGSSKRIYAPIDVVKGATHINGSLTIRASLGDDAKPGPSDDTKQTISVVPGGFPVKRSSGGFLISSASMELVTPSDLINGGTSLIVELNPSTAATLASALKALLREPHGCFEQTSATTYPIVMALAYFSAHPEVKGGLKEQALEILTRGYKRLTSFQTESGGFEWFGKDPSHEALTAYGILQFYDMKKVAPNLVDDNMLQRAKDWLFSRRVKIGPKDNSTSAPPAYSAFLRSYQQGFGGFGRASVTTTDAYIVFSLVRAGFGAQILPEIQIVLDKCNAPDSHDDPYILALTAGLLNRLQASFKNEAHALSRRVANMQHADGWVQGAKTSITTSRGNALTIETTAIAVLAWLDDVEQAFHSNIRLAMKWLSSRCEGGRFGSTQSTVLALKAIVAYDEMVAQAATPGKVTLAVDGHMFASARIGDAGFDGEPVRLSAPAADAELHKEGLHVVQLEFESNESRNGAALTGLPYSVAASWSTRQPESSESCAVTLTTALQPTQFTEGEPGEISVSVTVKPEEGEGVPMTVAIVGLPGGLEVDDERLRLLGHEGKFDFYERIGATELVFYWRGLSTGVIHTVIVPVTAAVPGEFSGRASRAYLYYNDEYKTWAQGLDVRIAPKEPIS